MKRNLALILFLFPALLFAQVTLEQTYNYSGAYTRLSNSGDKFFIMDIANSRCVIYNTNQTTWKTINLPVPANNYLYDVKYVSENLFTTDDGLCLAYVYYQYDDVNQYYTFNAKIIRENGTVLATIPGCQYLNVYNTATEGSKLVAYSYDYSLVLYTTTTRIYSLPGTLTSTTEQGDFSFAPAMPAFPNPASTEITIPYTLPAGTNTARLTLTNAAGQVVKETMLNANDNQCKLDIQGIPAGMYLYTINAGENSRTGKIVVR
ncbi:MAG: T9SS type A sorting domain-containing protein [Lentimicrobium sp.]|jgi:hypothetical protein|nr:T9SS type A sorting domain-containing protein [Lentimicrobium sp.]